MFCCIDTHTHTLTHSAHAVSSLFLGPFLMYPSVVIQNSIGIFCSYKSVTVSYLFNVCSGFGVAVLRCTNAVHLSKRDSRLVFDASKKKSID